jgi:hypothetical protein
MIREQIVEFNPNAILYDGFDEAIIGMVQSQGNMVVAYDEAKVVEIISRDLTITEDDLEDFDIRNGITVEDKKLKIAFDYFSFNVLGSNVGEHSPIFVTIMNKN